MVLLDIENLNILVLFLLAFISYKSYQADHHSIQSDSDQEMSEISIKQSTEKKDEEIPQVQKEGSQIVQNLQEERQPQLQAKEVNVEKSEFEQMADEQAKVDENAAVLQEADQKNREIEIGEEQVRIQGQDLQRQNSNYQEVNEKCDQQLSEQVDDSQYSQKNPQDSSNDDEKQPQQTNVPMQKLKKIHKLAKKIKKDLKKEAQLIAQLQKAKQFSFF